MISITSKRFLASILCAALLFAVIPSQGSPAFPFIGYTTQNLRMLEKPSAGANLILSIPPNDAVTVTGSDSNFYIIEYMNRLGYADKASITQTAPGLQGAKSAAANAPLAANAALIAKYPALAIGSEGPAVRALQFALEELNFYKSKVDGKYGENTAQTVRDYQEKNKLPVNGIADPVSQQRLFEGKPLNLAGRATQVRTLPAIPGLILRPGDRGDAVSDLQQLLKDKGYYKSTIDGVYGQGTENAVRDFQKANQLKVDGKVGQNTMQALLGSANNQDIQPTSPPAPQTTISPPFVPVLGEATYPYETIATASVNMRKAPSANAARMLTIPQNASITVLETSSNFLKVTYKNYTGYAMSDYISVPEQYLSGKTLPLDTAARQNYETLGVASSGEKVRSLQLALTELGYLKGQVDGVFGAGTLAAMKAMQEKNKLRATGVATPEIQQLIYEGRPRNAGNKLVTLKLLPPIPNFPMSQGDKGDAVLTLNRQLVELGHYNGTPGNEYTAKTTNSVKAFQKAHSIKQTGKADTFTLVAINTALGVNVLPTAQPQGPAVTSPPSFVTLQNGTKGVAVTQLQARLVSLGYNQATPDGIYGAKTQEAIKAFQMRNSLLVNGIADYATQQKLYDSSALPAGTANLPDVNVGFTQETLRIGSVGQGVISLQSRLLALNYLKGAADGIFGTQTAKAVTSFQRKNSLKADGVAGPSTLDSLYGKQAIPNQSTAVSPGTGSQQTAGSTTLRVGDSGADVRSMQQKLITLKYLSGGADGIFGPKSFLALQNFQSNNKLQTDGIAGKLTLAKLTDPKAVPASGLIDPKPVPTQKPSIPGAPVFTSPRASEVRNSDWQTVIKAKLRRMPKVIVYDFLTGSHYNVTVFSMGKHADGEPPTKQDTQIMENIMGVNNWTPRPVWIIFSDGSVNMASTHSHGHEVDHTSGNNLVGHICIHFPRDMKDAEATGPYAVSHQQSILAGWDLTKSMAK
ncbi:MAG: SH3 domain-containing protein [Clostridiales bacterium]|nr:SH3 domain-containing protein [Clostridiales bacterium]